MEETRNAENTLTRVLRISGELNCRWERERTRALGYIPWMRHSPWVANIRVANMSDYRVWLAFHKK